jgi:hypothetical protein
LRYEDDLSFSRQRIRIGNLRTGFTEAARNAPKSGPFPFFSSQQQHVTLQNHQKSQKTTVISEKGEY